MRPRSSKYDVDDDGTATATMLIVLVITAIFITALAGIHFFAR